MLFESKRLRIRVIMLAFVVLCGVGALPGCAPAGVTYPTGSPWKQHNVKEHKNVYADKLTLDDTRDVMAKMMKEIASYIPKDAVEKDYGINRNTTVAQCKDGSWDNITLDGGYNIDLKDPADDAYYKSVMNKAVAKLQRRYPSWDVTRPSDMPSLVYMYTPDGYYYSLSYLQGNDTEAGFSISSGSPCVKAPSNVRELITHGYNWY